MQATEMTVGPDFKSCREALSLTRSTLRKLKSFEESLTSIALKSYSQHISDDAGRTGLAAAIAQACKDVCFRLSLYMGTYPALKGRDCEVELNQPKNSFEANGSLSSPDHLPIVHSFTCTPSKGATATGSESGRQNPAAKLFGYAPPSEDLYAMVATVRRDVTGAWNVDRDVSSILVICDDQVAMPVRLHFHKPADHTIGPASKEGSLCPMAHLYPTAAAREGDAVSLSSSPLSYASTDGLEAEQEVPEMDLDARDIGATTCSGSTLSPKWDALCTCAAGPERHEQDLARAEADGCTTPAEPTRTVIIRIAQNTPDGS